MPKINIYDYLKKNLYRIISNSVSLEDSLDSSELKQLSGNTNNTGSGYGEIAPENISEGTTTSSIQSPNFVSGTSGWRFGVDGVLEATGGVFRGAVSAASIDIPNTTTANSFHVDTDGNAWWGATTLASGVAWVKKDGTARFNNTVTVGGASAIIINGTTGTISDSGGVWNLKGDGTIIGFTSSVKIFIWPSAVSSTTQFDITNTSGTTYRYTWDGVGTDPLINSTNLIVGDTLVIAAQNFAAGNNGTFVLTAIATNYFEITNASGVVESNKTIGTGSIKQGWVRPNNVYTVESICVGAGGGGGGGDGGAAGTDRDPGCGGGAGAYSKSIFRASDLSATVTITVGTSGPGGAGGSGGGGSAGTAGGDSSFGSYLTAYGGGRGGIANGGGGGGGTGSVGGDGGVAGAAGGLPASATVPTSDDLANGTGGEGGGVQAATFAPPNAGNAEYGGAGGGSVSTNRTQNAKPGGSSLFGGAGGGGGGTVTSANVYRTSAAGGAYQSYSVGGGGAAGANGGSAGTDGTSRSGFGCGDGGGGGGGNTDSTGGAGGAGGVPGGGGGGGGGGTTVGGAGGAGGRGEVRIISF